MSLPLPRQGTSSTVYTISNQQHPSTCPGCGQADVLEYVGYNHTYSAAMCAKIFQCSQCNTWVDVIREKTPSPSRLARPRPKKGLGFLAV